MQYVILKNTKESKCTMKYINLLRSTQREFSGKPNTLKKLVKSNLATSFLTSYAFLYTFQVYLYLL